jgi:hypothetical protein
VGLEARQVLSFHTGALLSFLDLIMDGVVEWRVWASFLENELE